MTPSPYAERLSALRARLQKENLGGFMVPMADPYLNEYVPPSDRRIGFLSGFTGSSAFILVLTDKALFFTDSRYTIQAGAEVPKNLFTLYDTAQKSPREWIKENLRGPFKIGFDPRLHAAVQIESWQKTLAGEGIHFHALRRNPVDVLWTDRPVPTRAPIVAHPLTYAGKSAAEKRSELAKELEKKGLGATVVTDPSLVAWLLNIRGGDVPDSPLPLCQAILRANGEAELFVSEKKRVGDLSAHFGPGVTVYEEDEFATGLNRLGEARCRVLIDPAQTPYATLDALVLAGALIERGESLCALPRACKNATEIEGMRAAHRRDGAALVKVLAWIDAALGGDEKIAELDVCRKLEEARGEGLLYQGRSFPAIVGAGPHGAIVHYAPTEASNRSIDRDSFLLIDSGGQYLDGTTDVTRTVVTGSLTNDQREKYTRVLKGHIALAAIRFPEGTSGADLDVLARQYLWEIGQDYGHGTGHGVGAYLNVHEGPQGISRRAMCPLRAGMVLSNEPGFYKENSYGLRLENLQYVVVLADLSTPEQVMLGFEPLTLVPFDRRAIVPEMLTASERAWLNDYHARVAKALLPQLDDSTGAWLKAATAGI